ncbi:hypothetical protein [uncultured Formosa sp.]|uniref:hypothetical protein n=1 Tax=uncultured Formosa sp. TaxID=255435 RepID=UPI002628836C|nr:hypothetical protein [uncultured Formosa sp.]
MINLKKHLQLPLIIIATLLFSGCSSDDTNNSSEAGVTDEELAITSFDMLTQDHTFSVIAANIQPVDSLVICLFPSAVDFANITPTIAFEGSSISYRINDEEFKTYSATVGESINFSYPNTVDFKITNSDNSNSKVYRIIVDTEHPIVFNNSEITIPDTSVNTNYNGIEIETWTNVGNYPIRLTLRTTEYTNVTTPETGGNNIFSSTLTNDLDMIDPNEEGQVNVFTSNASVIGEYTATALFTLNFNENLGYIVYDDVSTSEYVKDIGYKQAELQLKGRFIE